MSGLQGGRGGSRKRKAINGREVAAINNPGLLARGFTRLREYKLRVELTSTAWISRTSDACVTRGVAASRSLD